MSLRSSSLILAAALVGGVVLGCAQEPPRRPLNYGTNGNRSAGAMAEHKPLYEPSMASGTASTLPTTRATLTGAGATTAPSAPAAGITVGAGATPAPAAPAAPDAGTTPPAPATPAPNP